MPRKIEISHKTIIFSVFFLIAVWFIYFIRDVLFQLFLALLIMSIFNPLVSKLSKVKIPRAVSILLIYLLIFVFLTSVIAGIIPTFIEQTSNFILNLTNYLNQIDLPFFVSQEITRELTSQLANLPSQILRVGMSIFSNIFSLFTIFVFAFYLLLVRDKLDDQLSVLFGNRQNISKRIGRFIDQLEIKLGGWVRGQLILMLTVGMTSYVGFIILGIPYALALALLAGILEIVPLLGPTLAAIPAVIVGFGISPVMGLAVTAWAFLIQQLENYFLVPKVMQKSAGISPLITLLSLIIGFKIAGIIGAILSVPILISLQVASKELVSPR